MSKSVNKVILLGHVGKDPEVQRLTSGVAVAKFSMATSDSYKDKNTGETKSTTEWHNVVAWRGLAEVADKYIKKGNQIYLEGKIVNRSYDDKDGNKKYITEIVADNIVMLSSKSATNDQKPADEQAHDEYGQINDDLPF